jgi:cellulose biosynthesis protein BcsQ
VGKSTIAQNIAYQAVMQGHTVLFTAAANMLNDLASQDGDNALRRRLKHYARPALLIIDEVGYLTYSNRHADLMFEIQCHIERYSYDINKEGRSNLTINLGSFIANWKGAKPGLLVSFLFLVRIKELLKAMVFIG